MAPSTGYQFIRSIALSTFWTTGARFVITQSIRSLAAISSAYRWIHNHLVVSFNALKKIFFLKAENPSWAQISLLSEIKAEVLIV